MTTFSTTEMSSFKSCRRQWAHTSLNGRALTPWMPNKNLLLGTLIHATLADWSLVYARHGERSHFYPVQRFDEHWRVAEEDLQRRYRAKYFHTQEMNGEPLTEEQKQEVIRVAERLNPNLAHEARMSATEFSTMYGIPVYDLGKNMLQNYVNYYGGEPFPQTYTLIEVEQTVTVPIPGTRHRIESTFDMMLADQGGRLVIPDHKTYERRPGVEELQQNDQFLRYQWVGNQIWTDAREVVGTMYNGLWKRPSPPRGRSDDDLFYRTVILHDDEEIEEIARYLPHEAREMERVRRDPNLQFPNRAWSTCPSCGIRDLCMAMSRGEPTEDLLQDYTLREKTPAWRAKPV